MGTLFVVPTPIGNLQDMTFRAVETLKEVDFILAEDTRKSGKLLKHFIIETPMIAHHQHNEHQSLRKITERLKSGENAALISDAGTPAISDPGFLLTRECRRENIKVSCLPGSTAFVPALVNSGLPNNRFVFEGFLPAKKGRKTRLEFLAEEQRSIVFYESPYKILKTLTDFGKYFGEERKIAISREISKIHEENLRGTVREMLEHFSDQKPKGEFVLILEGKK